MHGKNEKNEKIRDIDDDVTRRQAFVDNLAKHHISRWKCTDRSKHLYTDKNHAYYDDPRHLREANSRWYGDPNKIEKDEAGNPRLDTITGRKKRIIDRSCKFDKFQILGADMAGSLGL